MMPGEKMPKREEIPVKTRKGVVSIPERLKVFNKEEYFAVLATDDGGKPYTSLVSYAFTPDMKVVLFATPRNTRKYKNIIRSSYVSLLIDNRSKKKKNLLVTEAITVIGIAKPVRKGKRWNELAAIFLVKHPDLEEFFNSPTTALIAVDVTQCVHVSSFQSVSIWDGE
jgi:uncharacterized pyridoxamine 5'-phosphate oxidase family protein